MLFKFGATVEIIRAVLVPDRFNPDEGAEDWTTPATAGTYPRTPIAPSTMLDDPKLDQPHNEADRMSVFLPYGIDVKHTDRVRILDGPYAGTYQIDGRPSHWLNPFTGWAPGCVITIMDL